MGTKTVIYNIFTSTEQDVVDWIQYKLLLLLIIAVCFIVFEFICLKEDTSGVFLWTSAKLRGVQWHQHFESKRKKNPECSGSSKGACLAGDGSEKRNIQCPVLTNRIKKLKFVYIYRCFCAGNWKNVDLQREPPVKTKIDVGEHISTYDCVAVCTEGSVI